jgi:hypothetical protein
MGRTIPSYRIAVEIERTKWKPFRQLLDKSERKMFDELFPIHDCIIVRVAWLADQC